MMTDNPFDDCEKLDEIFYLTFDLEGAEGLQALLAKSKLDKESLTVAASKLEAAGLTEAAKIVRESAARAADPMASEIAAILADPIKDNQKAYFARAYRDNRVTMAAIEAAKVDEATLEYVKRTWGGHR